jgi:hypothetical protein
MSKKILFFLILGILLLPSAAFAQLQWGFAGGYSVGGIIGSIRSVLWVIFCAIAVVCFVIAGILFLTAQGQPEKLKAARSSFIWGVVGIVVGIIAYSITTIVSGLL